MSDVRSRVDLGMGSDCWEEELMRLEGTTKKFFLQTLAPSSHMKVRTSMNQVRLGVDLIPVRCLKTNQSSHLHHLHQLHAPLRSGSRR